jgi:cell division septation protein DedD
MAYTLRPLRPNDRPPDVLARPHRWQVLAVVVMVMAGSASGLWAFYHWMSRKTAQVEVPLIRADNEPTRRRPTDPGGMEIPGQGTLVLDGKRATVKVEQLLPPPEAPLPRPAVPEPVAEAAALPPPAAVPAPVTAAAPTVPTAVPATPPASTAAVPATPPTTAATPPQTKPAAAPATAPTVAPTGKGYHLQLGAVRSAEGAKQEWERLRRQNGDLLDTLGLVTPRVDLGERGTFYRIQAGPIADAGQAERRCNELKRRGVGCLLVKP